MGVRAMESKQNHDHHGKPAINCRQRVVVKRQLIECRIWSADLLAWQDRELEFQVSGKNWGAGNITSSGYCSVPVGLIAFSCVLTGLVLCFRSVAYPSSSIRKIRSHPTRYMDLTLQRRPVYFQRSAFPNPARYRRKPQRLERMMRSAQGSKTFQTWLTDSIQDKHVSFPSDQQRPVYVLHVPSIRFQVSTWPVAVAARLDRMAHLWKGPARLAKA